MPSLNLQEEICDHVGTASKAIQNETSREKHSRHINRYKDYQQILEQLPEDKDIHNLKFSKEGSDSGTVIEEIRDKYNFISGKNYKSVDHGGRAYYKHWGHKEKYTKIHCHQIAQTKDEENKRGRDIL